MKKIPFILLATIVLASCNSPYINDGKITEEEAKQIIIDEQSKECCGDAEIISIDSKSETYIIEWEISSIYERGIDSVDKNNGKIKTIESSRGACQWK